MRQSLSPRALHLSGPSSGNESQRRLLFAAIWWTKSLGQIHNVRGQEAEHSPRWSHWRPRQTLLLLFESLLNPDPLKTQHDARVMEKVWCARNDYSDQLEREQLPCEPSRPTKLLKRQNIHQRHIQATWRQKRIHEDDKLAWNPHNLIRAFRSRLRWCDPFDKLR